MKETMLTYVREEPEVLKKIKDEFDFRRLQQHLPKRINRILILATGSSLNAALSAKYYLEKFAQINVIIEEPYNFQHYGRLDKETDLILAISQSGKSTSIINVLENLQTYQLPIITLTSNLNSPLVAESNYVIDLNVGVEKVGYVTKGFSGTVLNLFLIALCIANYKRIFASEELQQRYEELTEVIDELPNLIDRATIYFEDNREIFTKFKRFICVGYGSNIGTAKEFETKFTETVRLPSTGYELEAYMHGPYLEAHNDYLLFFLIDENGERALHLQNYMSGHVGKTINIVLTEDLIVEEDFSLNSSCQNEFILPLLYVVPIQIWSFKTATALGYDLDIDPFPDFDKKLNSKLV